jgi:hypothetical protein
MREVVVFKALFGQSQTALGVARTPLVAMLKRKYSFPNSTLLTIRVHEKVTPVGIFDRKRRKDGGKSP